MNRYILLCALVTLTAIGGCTLANTDGPPPVTGPDTTMKTVTISVESLVGTSPFALDAPYTSPNGVSYTITKFRYYISLVRLVDTLGGTIPVKLVDDAGTPVKYNLVLADYEVPSSLRFKILAPPGNYAGLEIAIGVPLFAENGDTLNHSDASTQTFPLNVGADMYWGWKPGYIHFKIEGRSQIAGKEESFIYHVGEDRRLTTIRMTRPITISATSGLLQTLLVDVNRLFVTPNGAYSPNIGGALADRVANSGAIADTVAANIGGSGFITLKP